MPSQCVIGLQWGDEAKGKFVDLLAENKDMIVRYQGGANAGHTVVIGDEVYKLHHIPSGIIHEGVQNLIAPGVVLNPPTIIKEIESLVDRGIDVASRMKISSRTHVVMPWHVMEDKMWNEVVSGKDNIGTTLRGIGPCYADKVGRSFAVRMGDLIEDSFPDQVRRIVGVKRKLLSSMTDMDEMELDPEKIIQQYQEFAEVLRPMIADTNQILLDAIDQNKDILFEGAQGSLLDVDHGTYPFVTSSNSSGVGISTGSGVPGNWIDKVLGVSKSYATRVGGGPFPTEQDNDKGQHIRDMGNEYGTTTGRPRRCGWWDAVAARYSARLGGVTSVALTMLDVLSDLEEIDICVAYEIDGQRFEHFPAHVNQLRKITPIYETLPGWQQDITGARTLEDLPIKAIQYARRLEELMGRRIEYLSVGPDRAQSIHVPESQPLESYLGTRTV
ncbi:MAG: adenylosuccinate synthase [Planctomycetota bacterium]